jgi:hypothetical protein
VARVIRHHGEAKYARNVDGQEVKREERIYLSSSREWMLALHTDNHFLYKSKRIGASVLCTCGSPGITIGYQQYKQYSSFVGNEVLMCQSFVQNKKHADGSS